MSTGGTDACSEGSEAATDAADAVRQRAIVDRALAQLFDVADSLTSARLLFSRYDRDPKNGELDIRSLRAMLQHLGKGQWEYTMSDARNVQAALAPGKEALPFAAFQREVQLCLLEALRRRWLAQSFSAHQHGQDWSRLWVLFTKHRSGSNRPSSTRHGTAPVERLTFQQFESAARKAGFGAHRGKNLKHTAGSNVCGMAANLSDSELKTLFALLVDMVQGTPVRKSLTDDGAASPATSGLTFEGFLLFMERGCLSANQEASPRSVRGEGGECLSPAARAARWAHTPRELHPHADRVFEKLLKLKSASLRGALLPPRVHADPAKTVPRLTSAEFARRLAAVGVQLTDEELMLLVAEFGTHNLVGSTEDTINVLDFLTRCSAYRRHYHSHETHQRNVLRQGLGQTTPSTPTSSSLAATRLGATHAADSLFLSSSDECSFAGTASEDGGAREQPAPHVEPEPEPPEEPAVHSNYDVEPPRPWSPPGPHRLHPQDRQNLPSPPHRRPVAVTTPTFASPTVSSSQKKSKQRNHMSEYASSLRADRVVSNHTTSKPVDLRASSPQLPHGQAAAILRTELVATRAERDEALAALAQQRSTDSPAAAVGHQQTAEQREQTHLRNELVAVKAELSATKIALEDSRKEVQLLRTYAARLRRSMHAQRTGGARDMQPDVAQFVLDKTTTSTSLDSWAEPDDANFESKYADELDGTRAIDKRILGKSTGARVLAAHRQKPEIPFSRQRSEYRTVVDDEENSHRLQVRQWANMLRASPPAVSSSSNSTVHTSTRQAKREEHEQAMAERLVDHTSFAHESPPSVSARRGLETDTVTSDTQTDSDNTSVESDSDETASVRSTRAGGELNSVPRTGMILRAQCSVAVRNGFDLASTHIGDLQQGDAIEALEVRRNEATGQHRVRIAVALHGADGSGAAQSHMDGWVSMTTKGARPLFSRVSAYC